MKLELIESTKIAGIRIELGIDSLKGLRTALNALYCPVQELRELRTQLDELFNQGHI